MSDETKKIEKRLEDLVESIVRASVEAGYLAGCQACVGERAGVSVYHLAKGTGEIDRIVLEAMREAAK